MTGTTRITHGSPYASHADIMRSGATTIASRYATTIRRLDIATLTES
jgi:hypothetical protein